MFYLFTQSTFTTKKIQYFCSTTKLFNFVFCLVLFVFCLIIIALLLYRDIFLFFSTMLVVYMR